jgi:EAL domain-containing protein (putative c-di-GMP-specific phosphodiesterase class I)
MRVVFEVVERNQIDPREITLRKSIVTKAGAKFALDDFGSGYSNHLALLALEPDIIKLDKELIRGIDSDLNKQYMIEDIINYSKYRGTKVLAEGIETRDELETLCRMGADYAQGYYLGMPMPYVVDADEKARKSSEHTRHSRHNSGVFFLLSTQFLSARDEALVRHTQVTSSLVYRLAKKLILRVKGSKP